MLPQSMAIAGVAIWLTGMAVLIACWRHLKSQERFQIKTRSTHYMPELSIAVCSGKAYHKATCEHVTDLAAHPVSEIRKFTACRVCLQRHAEFVCRGIHSRICVKTGSHGVSSAQESPHLLQKCGLEWCSACCTVCTFQ